MKKTKINFLAMAACAVAISFASCGGGNNQHEEATTEGTTELAVNTTDKYVCPMNCEGSGSAEAGNCPVCGMELVENPDYQGSTEAATEAAAPATDENAAATEATEGATSETKTEEGH